MSIWILQTHFDIQAIYHICAVSDQLTKTIGLCVVQWPPYVDDCEHVSPELEPRAKTKVKSRQCFRGYLFSVYIWNTTSERACTDLWAYVRQEKNRSLTCIAEEMHVRKAPNKHLDKGTCAAIQIHQSGRKDLGILAASKRPSLTRLWFLKK